MILLPLGRGVLAKEIRRPREDGRESGSGEGSGEDRDGETMSMFADLGVGDCEVGMLLLLAAVRAGGFLLGFGLDTEVHHGNVLLDTFSQCSCSCYVW